MNKSIKFVFFITILILNSCGGGGNGGSKTPSVKVLSDFYSKLGENTYCTEYGINDNNEVTLRCSTPDNSEVGYSDKIYKLSENGDFKEYPLPRALTADESLYIDSIKTNGKFYVSISKVYYLAGILKSNSIKDGSTTVPTGLDSTPEYYIWNGKSYDKTAGSIVAASDSGVFFSEVTGNYDSSSKQYLISHGKEVELKSNDGTFPLQVVYRVTNKGDQYGPGYNSNYDYSLDNLIWNENGQRVLHTPVDSSGQKTYQFAYANNKDSVLYYVYPSNVTETSKAEIYIQHKDGSTYNKELDLTANNFYAQAFNDNNIVVVSDYSSTFIFSPKSGLKNLKDFIDPNDTTTYYSLYYLNNNNKAIVFANYADGNYKTLLVDLGDF